MSHPDLNRLRDKIRSEANGKRTGRRLSKLFNRKLIIFAIIIFLAVGLFNMKDRILPSLGTSIYAYVEEKLSDFIGGSETSSPIEAIAEPIPIQYVNVTSKGANIRQSPSMDSKVVRVVDHNTLLEYQNEKQEDKEIYWMKIKTNDGQAGWISDRIVKWNPESNEALQSAVNEGNATAMKHIAERYDVGLAVKQNDEEAFNWYKEAADHGDKESQLNVGWFYQNGIGINTDYEKAVTYYKHSAKQGNVEAMNNLGFMYMRGLGVKENGEAAKEWFEKAINEGNNIDALTNLAVMYLQGTVIERDLKKGIHSMEIAEQNGDPDAIKIMDVYRQVSEEQFIQLIDQQK